MSINSIMEMINMKEFKDENIKVFSELIELCASEDLEFIEASTVSELATDSRDAINILVFRSFNKDLDQLNLNKRIERLSDTEFAMFETKFIEDVLFVYAYI